MGLLPESANDIKIPKMHCIKQIFEPEYIADIEQAIVDEMNKPEIAELIKPGMKVALAVGSRGIHKIDLITRRVGLVLKEKGAAPFIVPAMGSHGGGVASGQSEILESYGITEETMEMPVLSSMEVIKLGKTKNGVDVYIDKIAHEEADLIIPIVRIKPHTDYKAPIESGLCKMLVIGLGKHIGCSRMHQEGFSAFGALIPEAAGIILQNAKIGFGIAIVENAYDKPFLIEAVKADSIMQREPELLKIAKAKMPSIMLDEIDVLVINELGKDISGAGMDPNITGRTTKGVLTGFQGPKIQRIIVKGLTQATHGNATGIGLADFILKKGYEQMDLPSTYTNSVGSGNPEAGRIPVIVDDERQGIIASLLTCVGIDIANPKIVNIKNTLDLSEIWVSDALLPYCKNERMQLVS